MRRVNIAAFLKAIGEPGCMAQEVNNAHRRRGRAGHEWDITTAGDKDTELGKFRYIFGDGIGERDLALFDQLHERHRRDRLGHRSYAEYGIVGDT